MIADTLQTFNVKRSKVKITARRNVSAVKRYKSGTDRLTDIKLGEIPGLSATRLRSLSQIHRK